MKIKIKKTRTDDFATMFEASLTKMERLEPGQLIDSEIISISKEYIFIQLDGKSEGVLEREELLDKEGQLSVKVGDPIKAFFLFAKNGEMHFTTKIGGEKADPSMLEQAFRNKIPVEGVVEKEIKGGYEIKIGETRAFCPYSQMGEKRSENPAEYIGKHLTFRIQEYKEGGRNILVSNRVFFEETKQENVESLKKTLEEGMVVTGKIKSLQDFGAFVDIFGVQALLPISEIGRTRVEDINAVLKIGQEVEVSILKIDWKSQKISVSMKSLTPDPWEAAIGNYPLESKHSGKVVRVTDFGAFVNLEPGLDGLLHISEIRAQSSFGNSKELTVKKGDTVSVRIDSIDRSNKRVGLKIATTAEEDETSAKYMESVTEGDTYNPFAALLKKKK